MIPKDIREIEAPDVQWLLENGIRESQTLDYKKLPVLGNPKKNLEFARDVTAFANTLGGDLVFGVEEVNGVPTKICGFEAEEDELGLQIEAVLQSYVHPKCRIESPKFLRVEGKLVLVVRVPRSYNGPHLAETSGASSFYSRNSRGKFPMDVGQLRDHFLNSQTISQSMREFVESRLKNILNMDDLWGLARGVIHLLPLASFRDQFQVDLEALDASLRNHSGIGPFCGHRNRYNFEEFYQERINSDGRRTESFSQFYRNGIVESVDTAMAITYNCPKGWAVIPAADEYLLKATEEKLSLLAEAGVSAPVWVVWSIMGAKGCGVAADPYSQFKPIDSDIVRLPEIELREFPRDRQALTVAMNPALDVLWQSLGRPSYKQ